MASLDDVMKVKEEQSKFVKFNVGVGVKIQFKNENLRRYEGEFDGKPTLKFELDCIADGKDKILSLSPTAWGNFDIKVKNRNGKLTDFVYIVTKTGEGKQTKYDVDIIGTTGAFAANQTINNRVNQPQDLPPPEAWER